MLACYTFKLWRATVALGHDAKLAAERQAIEMQQSLAIARMSAEAAERSASIAEQALVMANRAFLASEQIVPNIPGGNRMGAPWRIQYVLRNSGNTPTRDLRYFLNWRVLHGGVPPDFDFSAQGNSIFVESFVPSRGMIYSEELFIPGAELQEALEGDGAHLYLWGSLMYNDVFPNTARH